MRVVIVEDHVLFAEAIRPPLEAAGIDVVAIVTSGEGAVPAALEHRPDVVLVDLGLPDQSGLVVGTAIVEAVPQTKVVALTALEDRKVVKQALQSGFHGYLTKDIQVSKFVDAIRAAAGGQVVVPKRLAPGARRNGGRDPSELMADQLTDREREVLALLVEGAGGPVISQRLRISPNTVRTHVQSILTKLQVHSRLEAATFAVRHGIVDPPKARRPA